MTAITSTDWFWHFYKFQVIILIYLNFEFFTSEDGHLVGRNMQEFNTYIN